MATLIAQQGTTDKTDGSVVNWIAHGGKPKVAKKTVVISMMAFAIMNVTTIVSLRGLPAQAEYGLTSIFYYVFAAVVFLIPVSLVAAELASAYPNQGGVFRWVGEAFGPRWGFAAIYYQWQAIVIWFPTVLIFAAAALAYIWWPQSFDKALANNKLYTIIVLLAVYWFVTLFTFRGIGASSRLSSLGGLFGTIIPGAILILLGVVYVAMGKPIQMPLNTGFLPDFGNFHNYGSGRWHLPLLRRHGNAGGACSAPQKPIAQLSAVGSDRHYSGRRHLRTGHFGRRRRDCAKGHRSEPEPAGRLSRPVGCVQPALARQCHGRACWRSACSARSASSSPGLQLASWPSARPAIFRMPCRRPTPMAFRLPSCCFRALPRYHSLLRRSRCLPSVQSAYQILSQMATIIYLVMYLVMYVAAIRLRYTQPDKVRPFKIPGGNIGMWFVGIIGLLGALVATRHQFHPAYADQHGQSRRLHRHPAGRLRRLCRYSLPCIRVSQANLESGRIRTSNRSSGKSKPKSRDRATGFPQLLRPTSEGVSRPTRRSS